MPNELSRRKSQNSFRTIKSASSNQLATVMKMRARSRTAPPLARQLGALLVLLALGPALGELRRDRADTLRGHSLECAARFGPISNGGTILAFGCHRRPTIA